VPIGSPKVLSVAGRDLIIFHLVIFYAFILHLSLMISFSKAGWHLPFALLVVTFFLYIPLGLWFSEWLTASQARPGHALDAILSPETIDALYEDARLHHAILDLTETVAKASLRYGDSLESGGLKDFGKSLSAEIARIKAADKPTQQKRQLFGGGGDGEGFFSGLTSLLGGGKGGSGNATTEEALSQDYRACLEEVEMPPALAICSRKGCPESRDPSLVDSQRLPTSWE
jgi:hypothetical protein